MPKITTYLLIFISILFCQQATNAAVLVKNKVWQNNQVLNVLFLDGNKVQKQLVQRFAPIWLENSDLSFNFFDTPELAPKLTHIRISFDSHTASRLGDHGDYSSIEATLLLDQLNQPDLSDQAIKRIVLHEFGHALGFEHEFRNPKWPYGPETIRQQTQLCIPKMKALDYDLANAKIKCHEITQQLDSAEVYSTVYDENSIMNYPLIIQLTNNQHKEIFAKNELSVLDKLAIQQWYKK